MKVAARKLSFAPFSSESHFSRQVRPQRSHIANRALPELFSIADVAPQVSTTAGEVANQAQQAIPGSVDAPGWIVPVAAIIVTVVGGGFAILLNPGQEAADKIFERDAKAKANKQPLSFAGKKGKGKQMVTKRGRK